MDKLHLQIEYSVNTRAYVAPLPAMPYYDFSKVSVLVVDDTRPMRELTGHVLKQINIGTVHSAGDGEQAFKKFQQSCPDIVLTDWDMAPVDGIELTKKIRQEISGEGRKVPVIIATGYAVPEMAAKARDAGVTELLVKPFSADDLAKRLAYVLLKPRDFIEIETYIGPDRRRKVHKGYQGPFRRQTDNH